LLLASHPSPFSFQVVALDGNPVPHPAHVPVLWLGTAERVTAIVENEPPRRADYG